MSGINTYIYKAKGISLSERRNPFTGKKRKGQTLLTAARHNLREIQAENGADYGKVDPTRIVLNEVLAGPKKANEVDLVNTRLFESIGRDRGKMRKDYVQASEHVISLKRGQEERGFFSIILEVFKSIYGAENILSATVHRDQPQPHIHILVSPISGGRYQGGKLHNNEQTEENKAKIAEAVKPIGFSPPASSRQTEEKTAAVIAFFERMNHPILLDPSWPAWLKTISKDPSHLFEFYGLELIQRPTTMAEVRLIGPKKSGRVVTTGTAKTERPEQNLSSVDIVQPTHSVKTPTPEAIISEFTRVRECDQDPSSFDPERGEFFSKPPSNQSNRAMADEWVKTTLKQTPAGRIAQ
jgi:hypothetical protein